MFGIPAADLALLCVILLAGGALTGLLAGLLGVGGGAIIVPVLYHLFAVIEVPEDVRMHLCVGTSLAVIIPTSVRSYLSHRKRGAVDADVLRRWAVPIVAGVIVGALIAAFVSSDGLKIVFGVFGLLVGGQMIVLGTEQIKLRQTLPGRAMMSFYGFVIGCFSSLVGIGGGSLATLVMAVHGRPILQGIATGSGVGVLISIPGALGFIAAGWPEMARLPPFSLGYVSFIGALLIAPVSLLVAPLGVRMAHGFSRRQLEMVLGIFLIIMGGRFLIEVLVEALT